MKRSTDRAGSSLIEFALVLPVLLFLIIGTVNLAGLFYAAITAVNLGRTAGDYMIMGPASYPGTEADGSPRPAVALPSAQQVANVLATDAGTLPNFTSLHVRVCYLSPSSALDIPANRNCSSCTVSGGAMTCGSDDNFFTTNPAPDTFTGEGDNYALGWADIAYTYNTFFPVFPLIVGGGNFNPLGNSTLLYRRSVFRVIQ